MDLTIISQFLPPGLLFIAVALYCLGLFLKKIPAFTNEWAIPFILLGVSLIITPLIMVWQQDAGWSGGTILMGLIYGLFLAALAVFASQLIKQLVTEKAVDQQTTTSGNMLEGSQVIVIQDKQTAEAQGAEIHQNTGAEGE